MVKVSVVIPIYNVENYLAACLDSIVNQTLEDIEIICINDGSTDNTLEVLNSYAEKDDRFTVITQENGGHAVATNKGMDLATGKYLYLMDSDDVLEDLEALEKTYKIAEEKQLDFVLFQAINYNEVEERYYKAENYSMNRLAKRVGESIFNYKDVGKLAFTITVTPWTKLYNRQFVVDSGARFPEGLIFEDNVFFWEVFFSAERIYFLKEYLFARRWHSASSTRAGDTRFLDSIAVNDLVIDVFRRFDLLNDEYCPELYNKKIRTINMRFNRIRDEYKDLYFEKMKENFTEWVADEDFYEYLQTILSKRNRIILDAVLNEKTTRDFQLVRDNGLMSLKIKKLEKENKKLKKSYKKLLNSKSWKITSPLRKIKRKL